MKIVLIGGGKVGHAIVRQLTREGHDIIVIDSASSVVEEINNSLDLMAICANGANLDVLKEADAAHADLLIACTAQDELNILCCIFGRKLGCANTIARVRSPEYAEQMYYIKDELGLSMTINPELNAAREIFSLLEIPGVLRRDSFPQSRVEIVEINAKEGSVLDGLKLPDFNKKLHCKALVCAIRRGNEVIVPDGSVEIKAGDKLSVCARATEIVKMLDASGLKLKKAKNIMIIGGSVVADYLTYLLVKAGARVKVIERNANKAAQFAARYPDVEVICADGSNEEVLKNEHADQMDAVATLTDIDEENLILSMYLSHVGVPQVITKVNRSEYGSLLADKGVSRLVSPKKLCADTIVAYVRAMQNTGDSSVLTLHHLVDGRIDALEFNVTSSCRHLGKMLKDIKFKPNILIACINRMGKAIIPGGFDSFEEGDTVIVINSSDRVILDLNDIFVSEG